MPLKPTLQFVKEAKPTRELSDIVRACVNLELTGNGFVTVTAHDGRRAYINWDQIAWITAIPVAPGE